MLVHCRFFRRVHQVIVERVGKVSKREANSVPDDIFGYKEAKTNGDRFYIAAQFTRGELPAEFILGNGKIYGGYENAPLQPETRYKAYLRGVTEHNGVSLHSKFRTNTVHYSYNVSINCRQMNTKCVVTTMCFRMYHFSRLSWLDSSIPSPKSSTFFPKCVSQF